jgi:Flp pilus assembly protein TadG
MAGGMRKMLPNPIRGTARRDCHSVAARPLAIARAPRIGAAGFRRDEDGGILIFSVFLLVGLLMAGGLSIDVMRTQTLKAQLQEVSDRAVLAAASVETSRTPQEIVEAYFEAAGLLEHLKSVETDAEFGSRKVTVTAGGRVGASFLRLLGYESFGTEVTASAAEAITSVEISLVLDISGSMNSRKLADLKTAATEFVTTVYTSSAENGSTISLVPYATQVSAGPELLAQFDVSDEHTYSHCVDFDAPDFETVAIPTVSQLQRTGHFDPFSPYWYGPEAEMFVCRRDASAEILPFSGDVDALVQRIDALTADGNTSIDIGVKWGAALLDPAMRPAVSGLIDAGVVSPVFSDRPYDYADAPGMKVLVLMTDGMNTTQYLLRPEYASGLSDVWKDTETGRLSIEDEEYYDRDGDGRFWEDYWAEHNERFYDAPYGGANAVQLTWPEVWAERSIEGHAYMRFDVNNWNSRFYAWDNEPYDTVSHHQKNNRLQAVCDAAKNAGIVIFTIGFEVSGSSSAILEDCATSPSHNFQVEGLDIELAFNAVASSINHLRLTK